MSPSTPPGFTNACLSISFNDLSPSLRKLKVTFISILLCAFGILAGCARTPVRMASSVAVAAASDDEEVIEGESKAPEAKQLRADGFSEYLHGNYPRAITLLETADALSLSPHSGRSSYILYYCYLMTGDYRRALTVAQSIANETPFSAVAYEQIGIVELSQGHHAVAIDYFQKALDFDAHPTRVHFYMGLAQERLKKNTARDKSFQDAEKEYLQILKKNPKDFSSNYELAALYLYWNQGLDQVPQLLQNCRDNYQQSNIEELPNDKKLYAQYYLPLLDGIYLYRKGAAAESLNILSGAIVHLPDGVKADLSEIYYYLGQDHFALGRKEQAKSFLEKSVVMDPSGIYSDAAKEVIRKTASLD